jgi:beta-xylosidase
MALRPTKKILKPVRKLKRTIELKSTKEAETATERQRRTAVRFITNNPYYSVILKMLQAGHPNQRIAEWGIHRNIFDANHKTVIGYLQYFRKSHPELCRPRPKDEDENDLDKLFEGHILIADEETELLRLIALQKARLGIGYMNEKRMNMLLRDNRKEVTELRELIMELARLRGLVKDSFNVNVNYGDTVKQDLATIKQDEQNRNVIANLVADFVSVVQDG